MLSQQFPDLVTVSPYTLDNYTYIFINTSIEQINADKVIREMLKTGTHYRIINCVGAD